MDWVAWRSIQLLARSRSEGGGVVKGLVEVVVVVVVAVWRAGVVVGLDLRLGLVWRVGLVEARGVADCRFKRSIVVRVVVVVVVVDDDDGDDDQGPI